MENQSLKKRLYHNLSQKPLKHTFLLQTQVKDPKSPTGFLRPKILQDSLSQLKNVSNSLIINNPNSIKSSEHSEKKLKPRKVELEKLSKEAKNIVEDGKNKLKSNLKPIEIFTFYDAFPQMIEDFFYLNRVSHPYDYQIVSYAKRNNQEYMTISSQGVTLYHDKEAQFLTREEWLRDEKTYYQLQKIDFFSQYKLSKNFMIWKNKMKRHYMKSMSNILNEKLFLTSTYPRKCLLQIRQYSIRMQESIFLLPPQHIQASWKELLESANHHLLKTLLGKIQQFEKEIIKSLQFAIDLEIKNFKQSNKIKIQGLNNQEENKEGYIYSQQAILRKQYKRVLKLIKLGQSILLESKIRLVHQWLTQILSKLEDVNNNNLRDEWLTIIFQAQIPQPNSTQINWVPNHEQFINTFKVIIDKGIQQICKKHDRITNHPIFEKYRNSDDQQLNKQDRYNSLKSLIEDSDFYYYLNKKIKACLEKEFIHVAQQSISLKKYIQIYIKHKNMAPLENIIKESSVTQLAFSVQQWKQDNEQMKDIPDKCIGMIRFDYSLIRKSMKSVAETSYLKLFSLLPGHLIQIYQKTQSKVQELKEPISKAPSDSNLVQFTKAVKKASEQLDSLSEETKQIKRLQILLSDNRNSNSQINKGKIKKLEESLSSLQKLVNDAETKQNQRLINFNKNNQLSVKKIKSSVKQYSDKLQQIQLDQKSLTFDSIIEKISSILPSIAAIDKQARVINSTEYELNLNETDFTQPHNLFKKAEVLCTLWRQKKLWMEFNTQLTKIHYSQLDCNKEMQKWQVFHEEIIKIKPYLEHNQFMNQLMDQVTQTKTEILLVKSLQSKSLTEKSWNQISQYLAFEFDRFQSQGSSISEPFKNPKDQLYTIQWLRDKKLYEYKEKIELIVKKSERESHLSNVLIILKNYIHGLALHFVPKKRQLMLLGDNKAVFEELNQHLSALLDIFNHEYSDSLKKETKSLVKHYQYVIEILQSYKEFGENWEKYEELFQPSRQYSKQLSKQAKDFANLQTIWKKIIKNILMENWSRKVFDQTMGTQPNKNTMKSVQKANICWQQIKKGIEQFLQKRRAVFPHYYYFSDEELLNLIARTDQHNINNIIPKIYEHIRSINFDRQSDTLVSVTNVDGQQLRVNKLITSKAVSEFEETLKNCEEQWRKSLIITIKKVFSDFISASQEEVSRKKIIMENVGQVVLAFDNIVWVKLAEQTYLCPEPLGTLTQWVVIQNGQISDLHELAKQNLQEFQMKKIDAMILQSIFLREKTQNFIASGIQSLETYQWQRTLKLCDGIGNSHEKIFLKSFGYYLYYGGQFMSPSQYIYITPEAQRNYINLVQIIHDRQIGIVNSRSNIESIRQLSSALGQNFRKFNFTQGINQKTFDRVLTAICTQGLWSCISMPFSQQIISFMATHIATIQKCIKQGTYNTQLSKYSIMMNQTSLPAFFINVNCNQLEFIEKSSKLSFRSLSLIFPSTQELLKIRYRIKDYSLYSQIAGAIVQMTQYCQNLFKQHYYDEFGHKFSIRIAQLAKIEKDDTLQLIRKKVNSSIHIILQPKLKQQDKNLLKSFLFSLDFDNEKKTKIKKNAGEGVQVKNQLIQQFKNRRKDKFGDSIIRDSAICYQIVKENKKNLIVLGGNLTGKTSVIDNVKSFIEQKSKTKINMKRIYFQAHKDNQLLVSTEKGTGIIPKLIQQDCQNWLILDGPLNQKYLSLFGNFQNEIVLSNYGVIRQPQGNPKVKFMLQTTNIDKITPDLLYNHTIFYVQENEKKVEQIIRSGILNFRFKLNEEQSRFQSKGDQNVQVQIKTYKTKQKDIGLSLQSKQVLINQIVSLIEKIAPRKIVKIKSIQFLYETTSTQLAYKCINLIQAIFIQNWDTIKQKIQRKILDKFAVWVVLWSVATLVTPKDYDKLEKYLNQLLKSNICDGVLRSIVFPGSGLQIFSIDSQRVQSALSILPSFGDITNVVSKYNSLYDCEGNNPNKNKFEHQFYFDQPHRIRVITEQSSMFIYFALLNKQLGIPIGIFGPPASGKKAMVDVFNKKNQQNVESWLIRYKKFDPYYLTKQIQKPFLRLICGPKTLLKPFDISKKVHISIDDLSLIPSSEPSTELIRMISNTKSLFDEKYNLVQLRQMMLTLTINQYHQHNLQKIDFKRLLSNIFILQTDNFSKEKLSYIFTPILENLCYQFLFNENSTSSHSFTNKSGENIFISSTMSIYYFVQDYVNRLPTKTVFEWNKKLLHLPKAQDICNTISNICKLSESDKQMSYYSQFWCHQILRVLGDKLADSSFEQTFFDEIKKYSFMQFKHSIIKPQTSFIFTNLLSSKQNPYDKDNRAQFLLYQNFDPIQKQIQSLFQKENLSISAPFITDQFIHDVIKVYRVLQMKGGHLIIASPLKKSSKYLVKIANFLVKFSVYHDLESGKIDFQTHIGPAVLKDMNTCIILDIETATHETLYMLTCITNRNIYEFDISQETKQKLRSKFIAIAQDNIHRQSDTHQQSNSPSVRNKSNILGQIQQNIKLIQIQLKIDQQLTQIIGESFNENLHIISCIQPQKMSTTKFLNENASLTKYMQVCWHQFKDETICMQGMRTIHELQQIKIQNRKIVEKCSVIYDMLSNQQKGDADLLKYIGNCCKIFEETDEKLKKKIKNYSQCLQVLNKNLDQMTLQKEKSESIQKSIEELARTQQQLNFRMKQQQLGENQIMGLQNDMKKIKADKDVLDLQFRQSKTFEKIYESFNKLLPQKAELNAKIQSLVEVKNFSQDYSVLVASALLFLNNSDIQDYVNQFKSWMIGLSLPPSSCIQQIVEIFGKIFGPENMKVPGWQGFSIFTQLKGFHFCQNFMNIPDSIFGTEPIVVDDESDSLVKLLSKIIDKANQNNIYTNLKLIKYFGKQSLARIQEGAKVTQKEVFFMVQKQIERIINEMRSGDKTQHRIEDNFDQYQYFRGIIIIGQYDDWQPTRNDIDNFERKLLRQKKIVLQNRIVIKGKCKPNITFHHEKDDLKMQLIEKSIQMEFGMAFNIENFKAETALRQANIRQQRKRDSLIEACVMKRNQEEVIQTAQKIYNQLTQIQKTKKKFLADGRRACSDLFIIQWILTFEYAIKNYKKSIQIYQFIKKCFIQINYNRQQKISSLNEVDEEILKNWQNLINANLSQNPVMSLSSLVKYLMPLKQTHNIVVLQHQINIEDIIAHQLLDCPYNKQYLNIQTCPHQHPTNESNSSDQQTKNLLIFEKVFKESSNNLTGLLLDQLNKNSNFCPVTIVISNDRENIKTNKQLNKKFRILYKDVFPSTKNLLNEIFSAAWQEPKEKKIVHDAFKMFKRTNFQQFQGAIDFFQPVIDNEHDQQKLKQTIKKFFVILLGSKIQENDQWLRESFPLKLICQKIEYLRSEKEAKLLINDFISNLPTKWEELFDNVMIQNKSQSKKSSEIQALFELYSSKLSSIEVKSKQISKFVEELKVPSTEQLQQMISKLPFAFNCQQFFDITQPFSLWVLKLANQINQKRFLLKKYLQDWLKILKGGKLSFWDISQQFLVPLPSDREISKLNNEYKIVKKGLQMLGLVNSVDASSKDIKLLLSGSLNSLGTQSIISVANQSFDFKNLEGFSKKVLLLFELKASKKLKIPLRKVKIGWRIIRNDMPIQQPIIGENCLSITPISENLDILLDTGLLTKEQSKHIRILMMAYDPTPAQTTIQCVPKQNKKQRGKKGKPEQPKLIQDQGGFFEVIVKLKNGRRLGQIKIKPKQDEQSSKSLLKEMRFVLQ